MTMTEEQAATANKYAEKIALLLRKAESTTPEEAELIMAKAQELMTLYAIDEQMIARASGKHVEETIIEGAVVYTGMFMATTMNIAFAVARANNCRAFYSDNKYSKPKNHTVHIFGFTSDVENVKLLSMSLEVQMMQAMTAWRRTDSSVRNESKMQAFKKRREFIMGFAAEVGARLNAAARAGREAAARSEAERSHVDVAAATASVSLVLVDRKKRVDDWFDTTHGAGLRKVSRRYSNSGDRGANDAGRAAGRTANIGQPSVGGGTKSIGKGR